MPVQIKIETDVTLADLVKKKDQGYQVEETPHVGNLSVSTLAMLTLGLQAKLVDITIGSKDNLFWPHLRIVNGVREAVANPNVMTTHSTVFRCGSPLHELHLEIFTRNGMNIFTHSSWMKQRQETIARTIEAVLQKLPFTYRLFGRYVDKNGVVNEREPNKGLLDKVHKVTTLSTDEGWVVPNPLNILFDLVCGSLETGKSTVYMLSGQSMYRYITQPYRHFGTMDVLISKLYDAVRDQAFSQLPEHLNVIMVPIPVVRNFVAPLKLKKQLDDKLRSYEYIVGANKEHGKNISEGRIAHAAVLDWRRHVKESFGSTVQPLAHICADSEAGSFYSQHDMAKDRDAIYIPDHVMDLPIRVMLDKVNRMRRLSA